MLVSDVTSRVRNTAGDVNVLQFTDAMILQWINDGIRECAITNNLLQKRATQAAVIGTSAYAMPVDILRLHSVKYEGEKLPLYSLSEFEEFVGTKKTTDTNKSTPVVAYIWANQLNLYPTPDQAGELVIDYIYDPPLLMVPGDDLKNSLPVGYHSRIVDYCLAQVALQDDNQNMYQIKMEEFRTGVHNLKDQPEQNQDTYPHMLVSDRDSGEDYWEW